jgi:hypothetical protein
LNNKRLSDIGKELGELCEEKNAAYGDSFARSGRLLEELYPNGIQPSQYQDMLGIVRVIDKLFRIATKKDAFGESPWRDIAGYGILGAFNDDNITTVQPVKELKAIAFNCLTLGPSSTIEKVNRELRELAEVVPECKDCFYANQAPDDMPCKKCIDKPFLPHFTSTVAPKLPGPGK